MRINAARLRNAIVFASVFGVIAFLLSWPMLAVLVKPGTNLIEAWILTADVPLTAILLANIVGFASGYRFSKEKHA